MNRLLITMITIAALVSAAFAQAVFAGDRPAQPDKRVTAGNSSDAELEKKWEKMSPEERREMVKNYERWKSLPADTRERIKKGYTYYEHLTPEGKQQFSLKMERYRTYSTEKKVKLRKRLKTWHNLDPEQQKRYKETAERFNQLPEEKKNEIKSRVNAIKKLPPERQLVERKALIDDLREEGVLLPVSEDGASGNRGKGQGQSQGKGRGNSNNQDQPGWRR